MPIIDDQKQKFLEYLEKRGLPMPSTAIKNISIYEDVLTWCTADLLSQSRNAANQADKSKFDESFSRELSWNILKDALLATLQEYKEFDQGFVDEISQSESLEETFLKISLYIDSYPGFSYTLTLNILLVYIGYCIKYNFSPEEEAINYFQKLIK